MAPGNSFALIDDAEEDVMALVAARLAIKKAAEEKAAAEAAEKAAAEAAAKAAELAKKETEALEKRLQDARTRSSNGNSNNGQMFWKRKGDGPDGEKFPMSPPSVAGSVVGSVDVAGSVDGSIDGSKDGSKANGVHLPELKTEPEPEPETFTLKEYEKIRQAKRKASQAEKVEQRKVDEEEFQAMQKMSNKKNNDDAFIKLGAEKEKKKVEAKKVLSEKEKEKKQESDKKAKIIAAKLLACRSWSATNRRGWGRGDGGTRGEFGGGRGGRGENNGAYREGNGTGGLPNGAKDEGSELKTAPPPAVTETAPPTRLVRRPMPPAVPKFESPKHFPSLR